MFIISICLEVFMVFMVTVFNKTTCLLTRWYQNSYFLIGKMTDPETWVYLNNFLHLSGRGDFAEESECRMMNNWKELATNRWDITETLS